MDYRYISAVAACCLAALPIGTAAQQDEIIFLDEIVVRGEPEARKFAAFYLRNGKLIAVDAVNSPPEFLASKKLIIAGASLAPETLRDTSKSMKEIAAAAA